MVKAGQLVTLITFVLMLNVTTAQSINYNYDSLGRLTKVTYPNGSTIKYAYDAAGNRIKKTIIQSPIYGVCPHSNTSFYAGTNDLSKNYKWQVDTGNGFINVVNDTTYSGASTPTLALSSPPTRFNGYSYRCILSDNVGSDTTALQSLKFSILWSGAIDNHWENSLNWGCNILPDENTDVIIPSGLSNSPILSSNAAVRSLTLSNGSTLKVNNGYHLLIKGVDKKQ